jgi:hypothetical protein
MKGEVCAYGTQTVAVLGNPEFTHKFSEDGADLIRVTKDNGELLPSTEAKGKL